MKALVPRLQFIGARCGASLHHQHSTFSPKGLGVDQKFFFKPKTNAAPDNSLPPVPGRT